VPPKAQSPKKTTLRYEDGLNYKPYRAPEKVGFSKGIHEGPFYSI